MSMSDTAEYWSDVKSPRMGNEMVYHIPNVECGNPKREHHELAKYREDVNCSKCRKHKEALHNLPSNKCPQCGKLLKNRKNKQTGQPFIGCSNYPKCKYTKSIEQ